MSSSPYAPIRLLEASQLAAVKALVLWDGLFRVTSHGSGCKGLGSFWLGGAGLLGGRPKTAVFGRGTEYMPLGWMGRGGLVP
jgi:hypothetical protein